LADSTKTGSATITLVPTVGIALTPSSISLTGGQSTQFNVTSAGAPASASSVTWTLAPQVGNITNGVYTAPVTINALQTIVLTVASIADQTQTAQATITLTPAATAAASGGPVNLSSAYNRLGIAQDGTDFTGGLDQGGNAYSAELLGSTVVFQGLTFNVGPANALDTVVNKTITLPSGQYTTLAMLATGVNGNRPSQTFTVTYSDGTTSVFTQGLSDWHTPQNYAGEGQAVLMAYRDVADATRITNTYYLYGYSFTLNLAKTVSSITLPNSSNAVVIAITLVGAASTATAPSVSPTSITLGASQSQLFSASNLGTNPNWTVSPAVGTVTSGGLYQAPSTVTSQTTVTVTATNSSNSSNTASATVTLNPAASQTAPPTTITLPIEVIGPNGTTTAVSFNIPTGTNLSGLNLYMQIHGLRSQTQASVQLNSGAWQPISESNVTLLGLASDAGGIGGGFHTLQMTMPASSLTTGTNTLTFRFNGTDGRVSGFRVIAFNVQDGNGTSIIPSSNFVWDDPNTWQPPSTNPSDISAGETLYRTASLTVPAATGTAPIKAHCMDCHTQDGRDLKYFNYSNLSISNRSVFHGLTVAQGNQIASYIRSLTTPNPGRPWNPPYQPGPGLDSQPVTEWSAGAGLGAVLDSDADMLAAMFPTGVQPAYFSPTSVANIRETQVAMQLPDWNSWLPMVHPMDAWPDFLTSPLYVNYGHIRAELLAEGSAAYSTMGTNFDEWNGNFEVFVQPKTGAARNWTSSYVNELYSTALWVMVKTWELNQEFGLEGLAREVFLNPSAEPRAWRSGMPFLASPNILNIPRGSPLFENGLLSTWVYDAFIWYHAQLILDNGEYQEHGASPIDWGYSYSKIADMSQNSSPAQGALMTLWQTKGAQLMNNGYGPNQPNGWQWQPTDISRMVTPSLRSIWAGMAPATRTAIYQGLVTAWITDTQKFTPQQFYASLYDGTISASQVPKHFNPDSANLVDRVWYMISKFKYFGVNQTQINQLAAWAQTIWPNGGWAADAAAICSADTSDSTIIRCNTDQ
jgi:hypothetical protein